MPVICYFIETNRADRLNALALGFPKCEFLFLDFK